MNLLKRMWAAFVAGFRSYPAEIDGCRTCRWAWFRNDGTGTCNSPTKSRADEMEKGWITEIKPYTAQECGAYGRKEKPE